MLAFSVCALCKDTGEELLQSKGLPGLSADLSVHDAVVNPGNVRSFKQFIQPRPIELHG